MIRALCCCLALAGCAPSTDLPSDEADTDTDVDADGLSTAVVTAVSSDSSTGSFATIDLATLAVQDTLFVTSGDPAVRVHGGAVWQLNRFGFDNLRRYTPGDWTTPVWEQGMGDLANPTDARMCGGSLFVSLYGRDHLAVLDPDSGNLVGTVDLSEFSDGDGIGPEPAGLVQVGERLYVGLNRMDRENAWETVGGAVAEVDCGSQTVQQSWMVGGNTTVHAGPDDDSLLVLTEAYGDDPAGLYVLDPGAGSLAHLVDIPGEHLTGVAVHQGQAMATSLAADWGHYGLHCIDLGTGDFETVQRSQSFLTTIAPDGAGQAWITAAPSWQDPEAATGLFVWDIADCADTGVHINLSLFPNSVAFY